MGNCEIKRLTLLPENVKYSPVVKMYYIQFYEPFKQHVISSDRIGQQLFAQSGNFPNSIYLLRLVNNDVVEFLRFGTE